MVRRHHAPRSDWRFVTTRDEVELAPLLGDFGQPVAKLRYDDGAWTGLPHVLKVFLLDRENRVRNTYSVGLLNPELVLNDVRTLLPRALTASASRPPDTLRRCVTHRQGAQQSPADQAAEMTRYARASAGSRTRSPTSAAALTR